MLEEIYNKQEFETQNNYKTSKKFENLTNRQIEKIKTDNNKINSYIGLKKVKNEFSWLKITNSYASLDDTNGNMMPHVLEGFYISIMNDNNYLHLGFNKPINNMLLTKILNYLNQIKEISIYDFINYIQKIINKKADWQDRSF